MVELRCGSVHSKKTQLTQTTFWFRFTVYNLNRTLILERNRMKFKIPTTTTKDKIILGIAAMAIAVAIATVHAIPSPDEIKDRARHVLSDLKDLNRMAQGAIGRGDFHLACELQKTSVDLMLKTYPLIDDVTLDLSQSLERELCDKAKESMI